MRKIAFIPCRPRPQPRSTQRVRFLFAHPLSHWEKVDKRNTENAKLGLLKKDGKPYKPTRFAYKRERLDKVNSLRSQILTEVINSCESIPTEGLFVFYLFKVSRSWTKKKKNQLAGTPHKYKPDLDNLNKLVLDALFKDDSKVSTLMAHKMWVSEETQEGILICQDTQYQEDMTKEIIEMFVK